MPIAQQFPCDTFRDTFATPSGAAIHFVRDSAGKLTALSIGEDREDRVWDLRSTCVTR